MFGGATIEKRGVEIIAHILDDKEYVVEMICMSEHYTAYGRWMDNDQLLILLPRGEQGQYAWFLLNMHCTDNPRGRGFKIAGYYDPLGNDRWDNSYTGVGGRLLDVVRQFIVPSP